MNDSERENLLLQKSELVLIQASYPDLLLSVEGLTDLVWARLIYFTEF